MGTNDFIPIYSSTFTDAWAFLKTYAKTPPRPDDDAAWTKIAKDIDELAKKHSGEGSRLNCDILTACISEIERRSHEEYSKEA